MSENEIIAKGIHYLAHNETHMIKENPHSIMGTILAVNDEVDANGNPTGSKYAIVQPLDTTRSEIGYVLLSTELGVDPQQTPSIGSVVTVTLFNDYSGYISSFGKVSAISLAKGSENYGGIVKIAELTTKLNNLENTVTNLISNMEKLTNMYNQHTHTYINSIGVPTPTGPVLPPDVYLEPEPDFLTPTEISDYENPVVVHGNGFKDAQDYITQLNNAFVAYTTQKAIVNDLIKKISDIPLASTNYVVKVLEQKLKQAKIILQEKETIYNELQQHPF